MCGGSEVTKAIVLGPGEGDSVAARGSDMVFKAMSANTNGSFSLMERELPPNGRRPPRHAHVRADEAFYVLEGRVRFWLDDETVVGTAHSFVLVPGGVMHTFGNDSPTPAHLLIIHAPAMDAYFRELHDLWSNPDNPPDPDVERDLMRRHGMRPESVA